MSTRTADATLTPKIGWALLITFVLYRHNTTLKNPTNMKSVSRAKVLDF